MEVEGRTVESGVLETRRRHSAQGCRVKEGDKRNAVLNVHVDITADMAKQASNALMGGEANGLRRKWDVRTQPSAPILDYVLRADRALSEVPVTRNQIPLLFLLCLLLHLQLFLLISFVLLDSRSSSDQELRP